MRGAVIYFSGTGNTEFVAKLFKDVLEQKGHSVTLIDSSKKISFNDDYSFLVFGGCIHSEMFPEPFMEWVNEKVLSGNGRRCIVFSTQAAKRASGANILADILKNKGFSVDVIEHITMPNNFYVVAFGKDSEEEVERRKKRAKEYVCEIVEDFLNGKTRIKNVTPIRKKYAKLSYELFLKYAKSWARKKLNVDYSLCVRCLKCVKNCPTKNISFKEKIEFKDNCICCQRCIHQCPVNAFTYKGKHFEQYKI